MKKMNKFLLLMFVGLLFSQTVSAQQRPIDMLEKTDYFGFTTMFYYNYRNWIPGDKSIKGSYRFDSFRIWAQTEVDKRLFAAVQYRFYEGWQTPTHLYIGFHINDNNILQLGQTWVPFGYGYQPFDDWGNITFYVGLQDDYDYGLTWEGNYGIFKIHAGFFKNQQLSSSSPFRYDADIFSGEIGDDYLITSTKRNEEVNQLNLRFEVLPSFGDVDMKIGISGMAGQIYNKTTDNNGTRYAAALHLGLNVKNFHFNAQQTWYNYTQALPDSATQDQKDFINMASWAFAYEIPVHANIFTTSAAYDIIGEKLTVHANYSYLWGGTSQANSELFTGGVRTIWDMFEVFAEVHYGMNDPQLSGNTTGYGRNASCYDFRFDLRFFYKLKIVSEDSIEKLEELIRKHQEKAE
jgi:hypothetical protein